MKRSNSRKNLALFSRAIRFWLSLAVGLVLTFSTVPVKAQDGGTSGPVYVVQEGDSLWDIALRFGVSMPDLEKANDISDPNQLVVGSRLVIPGLEGIQGVLTTVDISFGETLRSLSRRFQVPLDSLVRLNHLSSPYQLFGGSTLVIPEQDASNTPLQRAELAPGQSLLELSVLHNANPWSVLKANDLSSTWSALPGDVLRLPAASEEAGPGALPPAITSVNLKPEPLVQGKVAVLQVAGQPGLALSGSLVGHELHFFPQEQGKYVALQGVHAMAEPGLYPLTITGTLPGGVEFSFSQSVFVHGGDYPYDPPLTVNPETIDPAVTQPEDAEWAALAAPFTPEKQWDGEFESPAPPPFSDCWPSRFGSRRSYNGGDYNYFHTGLDFCGGVGTEIHAPAAGTVIFAGPLTVRGNATMIDHGWGVYTGYMHQSEILVKPGDHVEPGQVIGLVGGTGRVTGPHLHWEVFVGGVQVDPLDWLQQVYP